MESRGLFVGPSLLPWSPGVLLLISLLTGCLPVASPSTAPGDQEGGETVISVSGGGQAVVANRGRLVGTVAVEPFILDELGVDRLASGTVRAHDALGQDVSASATVDASGRFVLYPFKSSRNNILVTATFSLPAVVVRFCAISPAPRRAEDYPVVLDAGTTFVADKLRVADLFSEGSLDGVQIKQVQDMEDLTNAYLDSAQRLKIVQETDPNFNAFDFDHFMDAHPVLKRLVFEINPRLLRGWKPDNDANPTASAATAIP